ncbi:FadR/GntR family transcriptional regulator [Telmatospirillum sp. J64-1]|uniref:FadR/GntR family transcriptional regulator n=1 Tax=Telmatospirillum sp. J64-1 TaxID=2502183 RepID=UPI00115EE5D6|nr:FadR/GntR family transcriptional regulator [Telmatospirillum sp. J64-1]
MSPEGASPQTEKAKGRSSLSDRIYHLLFSRISSGSYPPNQKLPTENALAQEFGVSRPVLRLAMDRLRSEGLIYSRQGAGSFVRAQPNSTLGFAKVETIADIQRCYEFRLTIEPEAAYYAALRRSPAILNEMQEVLELLSAATGNLTHREDADYAFHIAITRAGNNHYYEAAMRALRDHIHVGMKMHGQSLMSEAQVGLERVFREHVAIFEAIRDKDAERARELMRNHIISSRDRLFEGRLLDLSL